MLAWFFAQQTFDRSELTCAKPGGGAQQQQVYPAPGGRFRVSELAGMFVAKCVCSSMASRSLPALCFGYACCTSKV